MPSSWCPAVRGSSGWGTSWRTLTLPYPHPGLRGGLTWGVSGLSLRQAGRGFTFGSGDLWAVCSLGSSGAEPSEPSQQSSLASALWARARNSHGHGELLPAPARRTPLPALAPGWGSP